MSSWQGAWRLLRFEAGRSWFGLLITILMFTYMCIMMMPLFENLLEHGRGGGYSWACNFVYLSILPTMGFLMNRSVMRYWSCDAHTRKIAYLRTMPIGWRTIVMARMLQHVIVLTIVGLYFFSLQYLVLSELRELLEPGEYIVFALIWYGYALFVGATYVYFEQTTNGWTYLAVCFAYLLLFLLVGLLLWLSDTDFMYGTIEASRNHSFIWPVCSLLLGLAGMCLAGALIQRRNGSRNLLH
ncbi:hypothetical protein [Paenibacillus silvisoli]|uniref:hypothetical protein n=1 Tax=Paenibacillus silvisoli TaxID=3110539 RepID=UPI0028062FD7|nr:hypothetical protein [Paenibacillus silvisoli]